MKKSKKKENPSEGQSKSKTKTWKEKALARRKENRELKKRNEELKKSRDLWKAKYQNVPKMVSTKGEPEGEKAKYHQYSISMVKLLIELQKYGTMSLRGCRQCIVSMLLYLGTAGRVPSHNSIRNWVCKNGYYRVKESGKGEGEQVLYVDESIVFGSDKILLILGIACEDIPKDRSVSHSDMDVLYIGISKEWKGESIEQEIEEIGKKRRIKYIVSDEGSNLGKAYKAGNHIHIKDVTHVLAKYLKYIYQKDKEFEAFRKLIAKLRKTYYLSKEKSQYMPPSMRGKLRFANIFPCVNWATKQLANWQSLSAEVQQDLRFLMDNREFIQDLNTIEKAFKLVCAIVKNKGFGTAQKTEILDSLSLLEGGKNTLIFIENIKEYLEDLTLKMDQLGEDYLLCTSDIIESFFGKFKHKINPNSKRGLTEFIFTIANFSKTVTKTEVKDALEKVKIVDLKNYKRQFGTAFSA